MDDHAVTNDASRAGAENQDPGEGLYFARKTRAQRVYDKDAGADGRHRTLPTAPAARLADINMRGLRSFQDKQITTPATCPLS